MIVACPGLCGRCRRLRRPGQVGTPACPRRSRGRAPADGLPREPAGRGDPRAARLHRAPRVARTAGARRRERAPGAVRGSRRRRPRGWCEGDRRDHCRPRGSGRRSAISRLGARRTCAGRRLSAARAELPRRLRRTSRAPPRPVDRVPAGPAGADRAEWQPRARAGVARAPRRTGCLAVRIAREPGRRRACGPPRQPRRARGHARGRAVHRGFQRRASVRARRAGDGRLGQASRPPDRRCECRERTCRALSHGRARQRPRNSGCSLPGGGHRARLDAAAARRRRQGAPRRKTVARSAPRSLRGRRRSRGDRSGLGLELPVLSDSLRSKLAAVLPAGSTTTNPIDFAGGEQDLARFEHVSRILLDSDEVDALLLTGYFGGYGGEVEELAVMEVDTAITLARAAAARGRTVVVHTLYPDSAAADALRREGVVVHREIERAAAALDVLAPQAETSSVPVLPEPVPGGPEDEDYLSARALVADAGIPLAEARSVRTLDEARAAAAALGYPLVLKTLAREHKSDSGGVVLGIDGPADLARAYESLARLGAHCSVERLETAEHGLELIVGVRRDPRFGPILLLGAGGIYAELFRDTAVALAPVEPDQAEDLLRSLRCAAILDGARAASALSRLAAARPHIQELEVNPLLVRPTGVIALDARVLSVKP